MCLSENAFLRQGGCRQAEYTLIADFLMTIDNTLLDKCAGQADNAAFRKHALLLVGDVFKQIE